MANTPNTIYTDSSLDDFKARVEGYNYYWQWQTDWTTYQDQGGPASLGGIFQSNTAVNSNTAFELDSAVTETFLQDTVLRGVGTVSDDVVLPGALHQSIGTTNSGNWNYVGVAGYQDPSDSVSTSTSAANGGAFLITPALSYISGTDSFGLLSQQTSADVSAVARILLPAASDASVSGMVMMRDTDYPNSAFAGVGPVYGGQIAFWWRNTTGGPVQKTTVKAVGTANWVKLVKSGSSSAPINRPMASIGIQLANPLQRSRVQPTMWASLPFRLDKA